MFEPKSLPHTSLPSQQGKDTTSRAGQPTTRGSCSVLFLAGGLSSRKDQDVSISHPAPSYLSLRLSSRWVLSWGGFCPAPTTGWQSLLLRMLRPDHLRWLHEVVAACQKRQAKNTRGTASPPPSTQEPQPERQRQLCHWPHPPEPQLKYFVWERTGA